MKVKNLLESDQWEGESEEEIIELGQFVRYMLKAGGEPSQRSFTKAIEYIRSNPDMDATSAAVALDALAGGRLEDYYAQLKRQNADLARYF